jgi:hypothetical protein
MLVAAIGEQATDLVLVAPLDETQTHALPTGQSVYAR